MTTVARTRWRRRAGAAYLLRGMTGALTTVSSAAADAAHPETGCGTCEQSPMRRMALRAYWSEASSDSKPSIVSR
jgi:hypothetical protein